MQQPQERIAVVSHSAFLYIFVRLFGLDCDERVQQIMYKGFRNGEMRTVVMAHGMRLCTGGPASFNFVPDVEDPNADDLDKALRVASLAYQSLSV